MLIYMAAPFTDLQNCGFQLGLAWSAFQGVGGMTRTLFTVASFTVGMGYTSDGSRYLGGFMITVHSDLMMAANAAPLCPGIS